MSQGQPTRRGRFITLGVIALAAVGAFGYWLTHRSSGEPTFETVTVDRGRVVARVTATGTLSALVTVQVGSQVSGRVQKLYADFNTEVDAGQVIAKIDPQLFEAALEQAKANDQVSRGNLVKSQAQAVEARRQYERTKGLFDRQLIAQAELETAEANDRAAQAQVEVSLGQQQQAKAQLKQAQVNLEYTNIVSPIKGIVISRSVDVGQTVAASLQAPTVFVIAEDLRKMQVDTSVSEADIGKLKPGMPVTFTVDAFPSERFSGSVRQIRNAATTVQNVVTYDAVIDVDNPELKLKPGMTANVTFVNAERDDVLRVPNAALRFRPSSELFARLSPKGAGRPDAGASAPPRRQREGAMEADGPGVPNDRRMVWVLDGKVPKPVRLKVGITDGTVTEVLEGDVQEGTAVITDATLPGAAPAGGGGAASPFGGPPRPPRGAPRMF